MMDKPDTIVNVEDVFGLKSRLKVPAFHSPSDYTPVRDDNYVFNPDTTLAILAGLAFNRRVLIQGLHGTGKSSHLEQVAAYLNWPCLRINLDSQISRFDLIGKDVITVNDGRQITEFREGILPFAMHHPVMLVLEEYDAGRPEVMFVLQRVLDVDGQLTLLDQVRTIHPNKYFRLFATANTIGFGDDTGLYYGAQQLNQAQLDRWHMVVKLDYLPSAREFAIIRPKIGPELKDTTLINMISTANFIRKAFKNNAISNTMSPRSVIAWAENTIIFDNPGYAFKLSFMNRCDDEDQQAIADLYFEGMGHELG
jgi:cobaltochelatase CobS